MKTQLIQHLYIVLLISLPVQLLGQEGNVVIHKDSRIDALIEKQSTTVPPAVNPEINGYRVQVFFDSDRQKINKAKKDLLTKLPKIDTYITYNAPNFYLKVGDFRTRLEAERIKSYIEADFPTSFVVKEKVNIPRLEKQELID